MSVVLLGGKSDPLICHEDGFKLVRGCGGDCVNTALGVSTRASAGTGASRDSVLSAGSGASSVCRVVDVRGLGNSWGAKDMMVGFSSSRVSEMMVGAGFK
eukprot:gb/GEZN01035750.1/.p2 GENE.gb/GEZN01035750.1/~~gb/GEZN01035750.1/.p2  ORF type:complete len:100 (-),score=7.96 gb/GEZN01035750.1/:77-376(-)